jgi:cytoskeletal protein RodZ
MFEIGASLREARTKRGLTPEDVQKAIRIRDRYLYAIEEEDWQLLPGDAYTKGFLRAYADFLGLDGTLYVDEYNLRYAHREEQPFMPEALAPIGARSLGLVRPLVAIGAIVAIVAAVAAWQLSGSSGNKPRSATGGSPGATTHPATTPGTTTAPQKQTHKPAHKTAPPVQPSHAVLTAARGRVWLQIRAGGPTGAVVYEGVLAQGQSLPLTLSPRVWMRVGAPWALDVRVGGHLVSGLPAKVGNVFLSASGLSPG